ncbi:MAG TPA: pentapeptide repeat-containing protein [Xanthobacteraceae bacterium]|nr:pentapeptide repeat-containing protein [Xanthobacteraceae bacterium]
MARTGQNETKTPRIESQQNPPSVLSMTFPIHERWNGSVIFEAKIKCEADASDGYKLGLAVRAAVSAGADLAGADIAGADLVGANLARANLAGADLAGALKVDDADVPAIERIDAVILAAIERGGTLDMRSWHGPENDWCGTTHCRAGWAVHCAGAAGKALQDRVGVLMAATLIYHKSRAAPAPWFFASNEDAMADIRKCAAEQINDDWASPSSAPDRPG